MMSAILGIFILLASVLFAAPAQAQALPKGDYADLRQTGTGIVMQVISPATLQLKSGEIIRLTGLYFPDYSEDDAGPFALLSVKILRDMLEGQKVTLYQTRNKSVGRMNRMGHTLAHVVRDSDQAWAQGVLLQLGLAMVQTDFGNPEMAAQMLALEEEARKEKAGLWEKTIRILKPEETSAHIGEYVIVQGMTESVALKNNRLFLNFGKHWKNDFTVTVSPENKRSFSKAGVNPLDWSKQTLRVRGVLTELNGPNMEVDHPGAIVKVDAVTDEGTVAPKSPEEIFNLKRDNVLPLPIPLRQEKASPYYQKGSPALPVTP